MSDLTIGYRRIKDAAFREPPSFLRFGYIDLDYRPGRQLIAAKWRQIKKLLTSELLNGTNLKFRGRINQTEPSDFANHSQLLDHIGNELLPICNRCQSYEFRINIWFDENDTASTISSILEMQPVNECSHVKFVLYDWKVTPLPFPVEGIENWIRSSGSSANKQGGKFLRITMPKISNGPEIYDHFKKVL